MIVSRAHRTAHKISISVKREINEEVANIPLGMLRYVTQNFNEGHFRNYVISKILHSRGSSSVDILATL